MGNRLREIFNPTPEQQKEQEERLQKLVQESIDNQSCFYCKHARLEDLYDMGRYAGKTSYCTIDGRDEWVDDYEHSRHDKQLCMFWEYSDPEERYE